MSGALCGISVECILGKGRKSHGKCESGEVQARVIERSQSLKDYSQFIHQVQRRKESGIAAEEALKDAIEYCVQHGILCEFLEKHGSEVRNMLYTE